jgi:ubiquinol-cytochrome c reductase cytochrome c subunit
MRRALPIFVTSLLFAVGAIAVPHAAYTETTTADRSGLVANGEAAFTAQGCYLCHGRVGQGARGIGATIVPMSLDDAAFVRYVRSPKGSMPAYGRAVLPDADLVAIAAYLHSLPTPPSAASIPLLANYVVASRPAQNAAAASNIRLAANTAPAAGDGKAAYLQNCSGCHGANKQGGVGPNLQAEGQVRDSAAVAKLIMAPPPGMPKLYPQPLDDAQVKAIAGYVVAH